MGEREGSRNRSSGEESTCQSSCRYPLMHMLTLFLSARYTPPIQAKARGALQRLVGAATSSRPLSGSFPRKTTFLPSPCRIQRTQSSVEAEGGGLLKEWRDSWMAGSGSDVGCSLWSVRETRLRSSSLYSTQFVPLLYRLGSLCHTMPFLSLVGAFHGPLRLEALPLPLRSCVSYCGNTPAVHDIRRQCRISCMWCLALSPSKRHPGVAVDMGSKH